jgi:secondary thiamine-phosphate synthase enzyme
MSQPATGSRWIVHHARHTLTTRGKGTYDLTAPAARVITAAGITEGTLTVFVRHTSCSLVIMENADPTARHDLHEFFDRLVPEDTPWFAHTCEGPDDMPSHIRMALTRTSETIPITAGQLMLGTWQGLYLFEHRRAPHTREIIFTVTGLTN